MTEIRAAGGVACRDSPAGPEVCLVHRPRYDDWSLPKGKLLDGEAPLAAAVREVAEETGLRAAPVMALASTRYVSQGRPKVVDYWAMRVVDSAVFTPGPEVDDLCWAAPDEALGLLSYEHDRVVLRRYARLPPLAGVVLLVRHATAGERGSWPGPDAARPLDAVGRAEAGALCRTLALFAPDRLVSAPARRCVQTLAPLAAAVDLAIEVESAFAEDAVATDELADRRLTAGLIAAYPAACASTVVCSQGAVIPPLVAVLAGNAAPDRYRTLKGGAWLLPFASDGSVAGVPERVAPQSWVDAVGRFAGGAGRVADEP